MSTFNSNCPDRIKEDHLSALDYFSSIEGEWEGMPKDTSFISVLKFVRGEKEHFVFVNNDLFSKAGKPFSHYEGTYFFNPEKSRIEFTTLNKNEIHRGYCKISKDTLFHFATIKNASQTTKAYASAIVKEGRETLSYYANYSKSEEIPTLIFANPLIYRKVKK